MAEMPFDEHDLHDDELPTGEELAGRLFSLVMAGVLGVIVMMTIMGDW